MMLFELHRTAFTLLSFVTGRLKMRDWNYRHHIAGVEIAGPSSYGKPKHLRDWTCVCVCLFLHVMCATGLVPEIKLMYVCMYVCIVALTSSFNRVMHYSAKRGLAIAWQYF